MKILLTIIIAFLMPLGIYADDYTLLKEQYSKAGNREAVCLCDLRILQQQRHDAKTWEQKIGYLRKAEDMMKAYEDVPAAAEIAIEYYDMMETMLDPDNEYATKRKMSLLNYAINKWESWPRISLLRNIRRELTASGFAIYIDDGMLLPNRPKKLNIYSIRNIHDLHINIYKVDINGDTDLDVSIDEDYKKLKPLVAKKPVFSTTKQFDIRPYWKHRSDSVMIDGLPIGVYLLEVTTSNGYINPQRTLLRVSDMYIMHIPLPENSIDPKNKCVRYAIVSATTGKPIPHAPLRFKFVKNGIVTGTKTVTTDENGEAYYRFSGYDCPYWLWTYSDTDKAYGEYRGYGHNGALSQSSGVNDRVMVYTDRSIYRPGQTVHAAAMAWTADRDSMVSRVSEGKEVKLTLWDCDYKEVATKTVLTDSFGTASADFALPSSAATGFYSISADDRLLFKGGRTSFHVEQYNSQTIQEPSEECNDEHPADDSLGQDLAASQTPDTHHIAHHIADTEDWFHVSANRFPSDGSPVYIEVGSSAKATQLYWNICTNDKVIASGTRPMGDTVTTHQLRYKKEYGDGIIVSAAWVMNGLLYKHCATIKRPLPDDSLQVSWKTFRDKLTAGQKETWTLHIAAPGNHSDHSSAHKAQLLATMYDKSLDMLLPHEWPFLNNYPAEFLNIDWIARRSFPLSLYGLHTPRQETVDTLKLPQIYKQLFGQELTQDEINGKPYRPDRNVMYMPDETCSDYYDGDFMETVPDSENETATKLIEERVKRDYVARTNPASENEDQSISLPSPITETAFFYPALTTDENGDFNIEFTLPESTTTWRFMALVHDKQMNHAQIEAEVVATKTIMVKSDLPRFLLPGEKSAIKAHITNNSNREQKGKVHLQILESETNKVVMEKRQPFKVGVNSTATASFVVDASVLERKAGELPLFIARVYAEGKDFSDSEQYYLPLMTHEDGDTILQNYP